MCRRRQSPRPRAWLHDLELDPSSEHGRDPCRTRRRPGRNRQGARGRSCGRPAARHGCSGGDGRDRRRPRHGRRARSTRPVGWWMSNDRIPADGLLCSIAISGGGVATSSIRSRRWVVDGLERHHQIDPRTDRCSATDLDAVTVIAPAGWSAEVHATAALAAGSAEVLSYLAGHGLSGIAIRPGPSSESVLTTVDLSRVEMRRRSGVR